MDFAASLSRQLDDLRQQGLYRELREMESPQGARIVVGGRELLNFSSNDYLGLAFDPLLQAAAREAIEKYGTGSGASRLVCGSLQPHYDLERALAALKGTEAALSFSSGYATAVGTICALAGKGDVVVIDKLIHASLVDAARLSGATLRVFRHNDLDHLEEILRWADAQEATLRQRARVLVVTESIFSMDGDRARLKEIVALKERYGAWLMVDEAHAGGILGANGSGLMEDLSVGGSVEVQMGTLGKAFGSAGGYIAGSRLLIDLLINRARSFIFSTAPVPAASAAAAAAVRFVQTEEGAARRRALWRNVALAQARLGQSGENVPSSPILPILIGSEEKALECASRLRERGVFIPAIRYPTVARGKARLRLTLTAAYGPAEMEALFSALTAEKLASPSGPG